MSEQRPKAAHTAPLRRGDAPALQDPKALLRRFIMAEVLGQPLALRGKAHQRGKPGTGRGER